MLGGLFVLLRSLKKQLHFQVKWKRENTELEVLEEFVCVVVRRANRVWTIARSTLDIHVHKEKCSLRQFTSVPYTMVDVLYARLYPFL